MKRAADFQVASADTGQAAWASSLDQSPLTRRQWLPLAASSAALLPLAAASGDPAQRRPKKKVAAVVTVYQKNSHADVLVGKILEGFRQDGGAGPDLELVSLYADQVPKQDLSRGLAARHGFRICRTIDEALTLGGDQLAVDGVLSVGEHGNYPSDPATGQKQYPRRRFFDAIADTFVRAGRAVPVFNDKHLAYRWQDAQHMYRRAQALKIPFMAGSSLPVAWREPALNPPLGCEIEAALAIGYGGVESYGFHALEALQCLVERRGTGERGVESVTASSGSAIWQAEQAGHWSAELFQAAMETLPGKLRDDWRGQLAKNAKFFLLKHRDGLRSGVAMANGVARQFGVALKLRGVDQPQAAWFRLEEEAPYGHFAFLLRSIEEMIHTGRPSYPVERTLLTTGVLDAAMRSLAADGQTVSTPELSQLAYRALDWPYAEGLKI